MFPDIAAAYLLQFPLLVSSSPGACLRIIRNEGRGLQRETHQKSRCVCDQVLMLHTVVFRVVTSSDFWEEGWVLAGGLCSRP